jgi:predicted  nucleic acid-binding Zn-ribbon protein
MPADPYDDDLPKIVLEQEDRVSFHQPVGNSSKGKESAPLSDDSNDGRSGGSSFTVVLALLLALGASGASGWLYMQNEAQKKQFANAQQRIVELENRLLASDEEMGQSAAALQVRVTELTEKSDQLWEQMDKLWASAWRRNQSEIKKLTQKVDNQSGDLNKQFSVVESELGLTTTTIGVLQEQLSAQQERTQQLSTSLQVVVEKGGESEQTIANLRSMLVATDNTNNQLLKRLSELENWRATEEKTETPPAAASQTEGPVVGSVTPP